MRRRTFLLVTAAVGLLVATSLWWLGLANVEVVKASQATRSLAEEVARQVKVGTASSERTIAPSPALLPGVVEVATAYHSLCIVEPSDQWSSGAMQLRNRPAGSVLLQSGEGERSTALVVDGQFSVELRSVRWRVIEFASPGGLKYFPLSAEAVIEARGTTYLAREPGPEVFVTTCGGAPVEHVQVAFRSGRRALFPHPGRVLGGDSLVHLHSSFRVPDGFESGWVRSEGCAWTAFSVNHMDRIDITLEPSGSAMIDFPALCEGGDPPAFLRIYRKSDRSFQPFAEMPFSAPPIEIESLPAGQYRVSLERGKLSSLTWMEPGYLAVEPGDVARGDLECRPSLKGEQLASLSLEVLSGGGGPIDGTLVLEAHDADWSKWRAVERLRLIDLKAFSATSDFEYFAWTGRVPPGTYRVQTIPLGYVSGQFTVAAGEYHQEICELPAIAKSVVLVRDSLTEAAVSLAGGLDVCPQREGVGRDSALGVQLLDAGRFSFSGVEGPYRVRIFANDYGLSEHVVDLVQGGQEQTIELGVKSVVSVRATNSEGAEVVVPVDSWSQMKMNSIEGCCNPQARFELDPGQTGAHKVEVAVCGRGSYELDFTSARLLQNNGVVRVSFQGANGFVEIVVRKD